MDKSKLELNRCAQLPAKAAAKTVRSIKKSGNTGGSLGNTWKQGPGAGANLKGGTAASAAK